MALFKKADTKIDINAAEKMMRRKFKEFLDEEACENRGDELEIWLLSKFIPNERCSVPVISLREDGRLNFTFDIGDSFDVDAVLNTMGFNLVLENMDPYCFDLFKCCMRLQGEVYMTSTVLVNEGTLEKTLDVLISEANKIVRTSKFRLLADMLDTLSKVETEEE